MHVVCGRMQYSVTQSGEIVRKIYCSRKVRGKVSD